MTTAMRASIAPSFQDIARKQREFYEAAAPIRKSMGILLAAQPFRLIMRGDTVEREIIWNADHKAAYDQGQQLVDYLAEQIMGKPIWKAGK